MSDLKAARNAYAQGYDRALMLGTGFAVVVVAIFAALVVMNPLGLYDYVSWRGWGSGTVTADTVTVDITGRVVIYGVLTLVPSIIGFFLLFNTNRRVRQLDSRMAALKVLGLLDKEKKEETEGMKVKS